MYRIGLFSKITKVTVKALRFYEEEGLLEPEFTDTANGYRYYSSDQLPRAFRIVALRQCGFGIPEIRMILAGRDVAAFFADKKKELESRAKETARELASINHYIEGLGRDNSMKYQVIIKDLPRVLVYSKRMIAESYDAYFTIFPALGEGMMAINPELRCVEDPAYCFIRYHDGEFRDRDIDIEICEAVTGTGNGKAVEGVTFKTIEGVKEAACALHKGPYSRLPEAYAAVFKWIDDNSYVTAEPPRESYIDGIWNKESDEDWLTELQVPVIPKSAVPDGA
ncbi:MAG TPA: MerR family transcriptional regulator [Treponemataceae bacterium]|nr:MerR family transcriptional regulator [Treponemataceae bacterium]HPS44120.1 MerR family transcriptional regulator [Treponemataceae bacterium]